MWHSSHLLQLSALVHERLHLTALDYHRCRLPQLQLSSYISSKPLFDSGLVHPSMGNYSSMVSTQVAVTAPFDRIPNEIIEHTEKNLPSKSRISHIQLEPELHESGR